MLSIFYCRVLLTPQSCFIVRASDGKIKDFFLVNERTPFTNKVPAKDILLVLFFLSLHLMYITRRAAAIITLF